MSVAAAGRELLQLAHQSTYGAPHSQAPKPYYAVRQPHQQGAAKVQQTGSYGQYSQPYGKPHAQPQGQPYGQPYGQPHAQPYGQHKQIANEHLANDLYVRLMPQHQRLERYKKLNGLGMQQSLVYRNYNPSPSDSLSAEMSRQRDLQVGMQKQKQNAAGYQMVPAGRLSKLHFDVGNIADKDAKQGATAHAAAGAASASSGSGYAQNASSGHGRTAHKDWERKRRNPILATGNVEVSHGYDVSYRSIKARTTRQRSGQRRNVITGEGEISTHGFDSYSRPLLGGRNLRPRSQLNVFHSNP